MTSAAPPPYHKSVFINCPFDDAFREVRLAILFSVTAHGYAARSALESVGEGGTRISRILHTLGACKYSIHDLSRYKGEGADNHARFNMPLELGMAMALRSERDGTERYHNWLALVPPGFAHLSFISDLAGFDLGQHDGMPAAVIREVLAWLRVQNDEVVTAPSALRIDEAFKEYWVRVEQVRRSALGKEAWVDLIGAARDFIPPA